MKSLREPVVALCVTLAVSVPALAQDAAPKPSVLITNANIFDGKSETLSSGMSVLDEENRIGGFSIKVPDIYVDDTGAGSSLQGPKTEASRRRWLQGKEPSVRIEG